MESKQQQKKGIRGNVSISELLIINDDLNREDAAKAILFSFLVSSHTARGRKVFVTNGSGDGGDDDNDGWCLQSICY